MTSQFRKGGAGGGGTDWGELKAFAKRLENEEFGDTEQEFEADSEEDEVVSSLGEGKRTPNLLRKKKKGNKFSETVPLRKNKTKSPDETESDDESH